MEYKDQVVFLLAEILKALNRLKPKRRVTKQQLELWKAEKGKKSYGPSDVPYEEIEDRRTPEERAKVRELLKETVRQVARNSANNLRREA